MAAINFTSGLFQGLDNDGNFVPYGLVHFTDPDTGEDIQTYSDSAMTIPNTAPVVLSPSGKAYIIVPDNTIADIKFADANNVTIWFLESYDIMDQTAIDNLSAILVSSEDNVLDAESYAIQPEDEPVQKYTGGVGADVAPEAFSALHWATKAMAGAAAAALSAVAAAASAVAAALSASEASDSANESALSAASAAASVNIAWADFQVVDGDLIVGYYDPSVSVPSIVDGDFLITY